MIFSKNCLGCPPFLGYICWPKVVGALLLLSALLALLFFRRPCARQLLKYDCSPGKHSGEKFPCVFDNDAHRQLLMDPP